MSCPKCGATAFLPCPVCAYNKSPAGVANPSAPGVLPAGVSVSMVEYLDSHELVTFTLSAGIVPPGTEWRREVRVHSEAMFVREIAAIAAGGTGDVNLVLDSSTVKLVDSHRVIFERPLGILTTRNRNAETEERLARLERMMNVLVEQESPAGEALRRLGGAKIEYESPTRLAFPALFRVGSIVEIILTVHDALSLPNDVVVRVSVLGVSKNPVP